VRKGNLWLRLLVLDYLMSGKVGGGLRSCRLSELGVVLDIYRDIRRKGVRWGIVFMVGLMVAAEI
jgi:hypothetical protein